MSFDTESEDDKRIRLGEEILKLSIEIAELEGRKIPHMSLDENNVFRARETSSTDKKGLQNNSYRLLTNG